jgi:hypothetical protein
MTSYPKATKKYACRATWNREEEQGIAWMAFAVRLFKG